MAAFEVVRRALQAEPMTGLSVALYIGNIGWQLSHRSWGMAVYWFAASLITISATWLPGWKS